jgi:hypothetical protein
MWHRHEAVFLIGFAAGRVSYDPQAKWLYSFRVFMGVFKAEILWQTGNRRNLRKQNP